MEEENSEVSSRSIEEDREKMREKKFMLITVHKMIMQKLGVKFHDIEIVSIIVKPQETVVLIDYFGHINFLSVLRNSKKEISQGFQKIFETSLSYPIVCEENLANWQAEKLTFWKKYLESEYNAVAAGDVSNIDESMDFYFDEMKRIAGGDISIKFVYGPTHTETTKKGMLLEKTPSISTTSSMRTEKEKGKEEVEMMNMGTKSQTESGEREESLVES